MGPWIQLILRDRNNILGTKVFSQILWTKDFKINSLISSIKAFQVTVSQTCKQVFNMISRLIISGLPKHLCKRRIKVQAKWVVGHLPRTMEFNNQIKRWAVGECNTSVKIHSQSNNSLVTIHIKTQIVHWGMLAQIWWGSRKPYKIRSNSLTLILKHIHNNNSSIKRKRIIQNSTLSILLFPARRKMMVT